MFGIIKKDRCMLREFFFVYLLGFPRETIHQGVFAFALTIGFISFLVISLF